MPPAPTAGVEAALDSGVICGVGSRLNLGNAGRGGLEYSAFRVGSRVGVRPRWHVEVCSPFSEGADDDEDDDDDDDGDDDDDRNVFGLRGGDESATGTDSKPAWAQVGSKSIVSSRAVSFGIIELQQ